MIARLARTIHWSGTVQWFLTLTLAFFSVLALSQSFHAARWVRDDSPVQSGFWLGLIFGWALARTRWRGWKVAVYTLAVSTAAAGQNLGGIVQVGGMSDAGGFWQALDLLNLRALAFVYRANGWFWAFFSGQRVEDTGFFIFLTAILAFIAIVWLLWWVIRQKAALPGVLLGGVLLAVNTHLSRQNSAFLLLFIFTGVLLLARTALQDRYRDWDRRTVDYPYDLGLNWGVVAAGLALTIGLTAWLAGIIGTPASWRKAADWLEKTRRQTGETVERLFPNVNPPVTDRDAVNAETPNLAEIGAPLPRGSTTIMTVSLNDPAPPPPDVPVSDARPPAHYWRSEIFGEYTGRGWKQVPEGPLAPGSPTRPPPGRYALEQSFSILVGHGDTLYAASQPGSADEAVRRVLAGADGSTLLRGSIDNYRVTSWAPQVTAAQLRSAGSAYPAEIAGAYLQLPAGLPQRVRSLAERVAGGAETPFDQAVRVQNYLRENFDYDLAAELAPVNADVVDDFLFRSQAGFCSHFASAMTVMLRARGIPARVVGGYATGGYDYEQHEYRVPADAAHAWVEVYFPVFGWIEFEPTAAVGTILYPEGDQAVAAVQEPLPEQTSGRTVNGWVVLGAAAAAALMFALLRWAGSLEGTPGGKANQATAFYRHVRRSLAWLGLGALPSTTPQEFLRQHHNALRGLPRLQAALRSVTALHEQAVYSPRLPSRSALQTVRGSWRQSWREQVRLGSRRLGDIMRRSKE